MSPHLGKVSATAISRLFAESVAEEYRKRVFFERAMLDKPGSSPSIVGLKVLVPEPFSKVTNKGSGE
jgi:hypothetical protein